MSNSRSIVTFVAVVVAIVTSSCESSDNSRAARGPSPNSPNEAGGEIPDSPNSGIQTVYAAGWQEVEMVANWAKTKIGVAGHFSTSRNACGKEEYGALDIKLWNPLAETVNAAVKDDPLPEDYCLKLPEGVPGERYRVMDGVAEAILENGGKRALFETRGGEVCTRIANREAATRLLDFLHKIVVIADEEGCPNGWASGLY